MRDLRSSASFSVSKPSRAQAVQSSLRRPGSLKSPASSVPEGRFHDPLSGVELTALVSNSLDARPSTREQPEGRDVSWAGVAMPLRNTENSG
jgi:hypothetical protein